MKDFIIGISGVLSVALAVYCSIPYILSIIKGKTKPHQFSWIIFTLMNGIVLLSQFLEGARLSVLISAAFLISDFIIVGLSFKYGVRDTSVYDRLLFSFCLFTIVIWILTKSNSAAIWLTVLIDIVATTMLMLKVKKLPESEALQPWILGALAYSFSCVTLLNKPFGILFVRPIYGLLSDLAIVATVYISHIAFTRKSPTVDSPSKN
jgi:hypothetical protein